MKWWRRHNTAKSLGKGVNTYDKEDLGGVSDILGALLGRFNTPDVSIKLFDLRSDIDIPVVYFAFLDKKERGMFRFNHGTGAAGSLEKATIRAVTEANLAIHQKKYSAAKGLPLPTTAEFSFYNFLPKDTSGAKDIPNPEMEDILDEIKGVVSILKKWQRSTLQEYYFKRNKDTSSTCYLHKHHTLSHVQSYYLFSINTYEDSFNIFL